MEKSRAAVISRIEQLQVTKGAVLKYLAESSPMSAETLFSIFYEFLDDFESSRIMLEKKELTAQRERRLSTAKKLEGRSKVAGMINDKSTALARAITWLVCHMTTHLMLLFLPCVGDQRGVVDNVLATLRSGRRSSSISQVTP